MKNIYKKIGLGTGEILKNNFQERLKVIETFLKEGGSLIDTASIL